MGGRDQARGAADPPRRLRLAGRGCAGVRQGGAPAPPRPLPTVGPTRVPTVHSLTPSLQAALAFQGERAKLNFPELQGQYEREIAEEQAGEEGEEAAAGAEEDGGKGRPPGAPFPPRGAFAGRGGEAGGGAAAAGKGAGGAGHSRPPSGVKFDYATGQRLRVLYDDG